MGKKSLYYTLRCKFFISAFIFVVFFSVAQWTSCHPFNVIIAACLFSNEDGSYSVFITTLHVSLTFHTTPSTGVKCRNSEIRNTHVGLNLDKSLEFCKQYSFLIV